MYDISDEDYDNIMDDDVERLKFAYRLLKQVLFGEESIALNEGAYDQRMEERKDILEARRQAEVEMARQKEPFENYIQD